jgi:hypothetical protein
MQLVLLGCFMNKHLIRSVFALLKNTAPLLVLPVRRAKNDCIESKVWDEI